MIIVKEQRAKKVPGITSLFISFNYNQSIIDELRQLDCKVYDKKTQEWEIPIVNFNKLANKLSFIDDISILPLDEEKKESKNYNLLNYKTPCFDYQKDGILYGLNNDRWLLLDVPGLGKTKQMCNLIEELKDKKDAGKALIICGVNALKSNWVNEINKHSYLSSKILGSRVKKNGSKYIGSVKDRLEDLKNNIEEDIIITNIETLRDDSIIKELKKGLFDIIIVDECHKCKSPTAIQSKNLLKLDAKYKIGLTGTILLNNPLDLYVPLKFIDVEKSTFTNFKNLYCQYGGFGGYQIIGYKNIDFLKQELESCSLRRTKDLLNLPPKNIIEEYIDMNDDQSKFYSDIVHGVISDCDKADLSRMTLLSSIARLRQVTSYPQMLTSEKISSAKIDRTLDLVDQIVSSGNKVVIFSTFKEPVKYLASVISNSVTLTGDTKDSEIDDIISKFQNDNNYKVFIGTWQKCGTGLTLTAASYMIFLDTPYTDGVFQQACDRIYRIGTKDSVFIYNLICKNTVDERVLKIVNNKRYLSDYVVDDIQNDDVIYNLKDYIEELKSTIF